MQREREKRQAALRVALRVFICFLKVGILGEISGEDLLRIFISFPGVSFRVLVFTAWPPRGGYHQSLHLVLRSVLVLLCLFLSFFFFFPLGLELKQLRPRCYLYFYQNTVSVVIRSEHLFLG